jgi:hypothetical protein
MATSRSQSTRRRWKESEARGVLEAARASGLTLSAFVCLRHMCMTGRAERGYRDPALKRAACPRQA